MSHRQFQDPDGTIWTVWDVHPSRVERDLDLARRGMGAGNGSERRSRSTLTLDGPLALGWLCFESVRGKRRLAPIPTDWQYLSNEELGQLRDRATVVVAPRRRAESTAELPSA